MCGIAGIISLNDTEIVQSQLESMVNIISHRGPNGSGFFLDHRVALGHARLSILDLSNAAAQPMWFAKKYVIVYNGEVYNYVELGDKLKSLGYNFKTSSDTEVILAAYDYWGENCVNEFNGMWSFAIFDIGKQKIFCSRDRFGVKPFYYNISEDNFVFGSEIKQILEFLPSRKVNKQILVDYLILSLLEHNENTFFEGIKKLPPAHNLIFDLKTNKISIKRYFSIKIDEAVGKLSEEDSILLFQKEFERSIKFRLRSDVKVATCLSGGLDSSSVAAIASSFYNKNSGKKFSAITARSTNSLQDETQYAAKVVNSSDLDWHVIEPQKEDFLKALDEVIITQEEPFGGPSVIMQYYVFKKAKEINAPVMLDGQGGDETLLGYERYYPAFLLSLPLKERYKAFTNSAKNSKLSLFELLLYFFYFTFPTIRIWSLLIRSSFIKKEYKNLLNKDLIKKMAKNYSNIKELQLFEISYTQLPALLKYEDRNSMRHSIESRLPFLDYQLVELSLSMNNSYKIKNGWTKYILRKAMDHNLPADITWRKNKIGFEAPSNEWLSNKEFFISKINNSKILKQLLSSPYKKTADLKMLWKLYNVARWEELYKVEMDTNTPNKESNGRN
jgi:asparagine synthase (glutamine-hydrolysing)